MADPTRAVRAAWAVGNADRVDLADKADPAVAVASEDKVDLAVNFDRAVVPAETCRADQDMVPTRWTRSSRMS